jgi:hypothetical protein
LFYIAYRRVAEQALVFAVAMGGVAVADPEPGAGGI